jgi:hypothetical protein
LVEDLKRVLPKPPLPPRTAGAGAVLAHAVAALLRLEVLLVAIVEQRIEVRHAFEDDIAALAAVTTVRSAELDVFLAAEADAAIAAVAGAYIDLGFVEELHLSAIREG